MCFSAPVSLVTSGGLMGLSAASCKYAKKELQFLSAVPLMFSIQQLLEGLQWLAQKPSVVSDVLGYGFLFFAFLVWPVYFPYAVLKLETNAITKKFLKGLVAIGGLITLYLFGVLLTQPMSIDIINKSINYNIEVPFELILSFFYVSTTAGSAMMSSHKTVRLFGTAVFMSAVLAWVLFQGTFISTWCLFSAILSISIFYLIRQK